MPPKKQVIAKIQADVTAAGSSAPKRTRCVSRGKPTSRKRGASSPACDSQSESSSSDDDSDPDDDVVIGTALAAQATWVVTGDKPLLSVGQYQNVRIVSVSQFCELF